MEARRHHGARRRSRRLPLDGAQRPAALRRARRLPLHARGDVGRARFVRHRSTTTSSPPRSSTRSQVLRALAGMGRRGPSSSARRSWAARAASLKQWIWGALVTLTFELFVYAIFNLGVKLGPWAKDEIGLARPIWERHGFWVIVDRRAALPARARQLLALGSVGDALRRGRARDPRARRLDLALVGAGRLVLVEADPRTSGSRRSRWRSLGVHYQPDQMLHRRRAAPRRRTRSGSCARRTSS